MMGLKMRRLRACFKGLIDPSLGSLRHKQSLPVDTGKTLSLAAVRANARKGGAFLWLGRRVESLTQELLVQAQ